MRVKFEMDLVEVFEEPNATLLKKGVSQRMRRLTLTTFRHSLICSEARKGLILTMSWILLETH